MRFLSATTLMASLLLAQPAAAADDQKLNRAMQDHVAYVATFAMPVLIEKCDTLYPGYLAKAAPAYFRFVNARQDAIDRGRLLTSAEFDADTTPKAYREKVVQSRLGALDSGTPEQKARTCDGALAFLGGMTIPGEWPPRD